MFLDTSHNSLTTVLSNIHSAFLETALKTHTYIRCLPRPKQPRAGLVTRAVSDLVELAFVLMKSKGRKRGQEAYACRVSKAQVDWLAMCAFRTVFGRRQSRYRAVLDWIEQRLARLRAREGALCGRMEGIVRQAALESAPE